MHVSKSRHPLKPCFVEQCPHCRRIGEFWLVQLSGHVGPFGGTGFSIACISCRFEKLVSDADAQRFQRLADRYREVSCGLLTIQAFEEAIEAAHLSVIDEIRAEGKVWVCGKCEEENPETFDLCWQCGSASPKAGSPRDPEPPRLPDVGGRYEWE